jgi:uncharacterized protein
LEKNVTQFLDLARTGRHQWWAYLLGLLLIEISGGVGEHLDDLMLEVYDNGSFWASIYSSSYSNLSEAIYRSIYCIVVLPCVFGSLAALLCMFVLVRLLHRRPFRSIITTGDRLNRRYLVQGFGLSFLLFSAAFMVDYFLSCSNPLSGVHLPPLSGMHFIAIPLRITISATREEVQFRGYMLQGLGLLTRNRIVLALVIGLLFMMGHLGKPGLTYNILLADFEGGVFYTIMTLKSNGLEFAIGSHIAYNLAGGLIAWSLSYTPMYFPILFPICAVIMYLIIFRRKPIPHTESEQP